MFVTLCCESNVLCYNILKGAIVIEGEYLMINFEYHNNLVYIFYSDTLICILNIQAHACAHLQH